MHKKLAADLTSLAHSILQLKNKDDVFALKQKAHEVYEKLSVLAYVEEYINTTPNADISKEELIEKIENATSTEKTENLIIKELDEEQEIDDAADDIANDVFESIENDDTIEEKVDEILEQPFDEIEEILFSNNNDLKNDMKDIGDLKTPTLEEELQDTISVDVAADLFENAEPKKSLNDALQGNIQIGLNDRIAFVKNLFDGNQEDFNRVVSQLNTFKTGKEARKFINKMVKSDYDWSDKEEYENRLLEIIERRFQ
ncbi:hypothetical protein OD91_1228 [Lutibacter sp. Hel_I_33_5]|uniref:hypothetical protein n=1 Tax=Lutibacter sp. Hel_I_33_5 TaxID=1566289 RepID=UPI0011A31AEF|nr:hypothetical protein [Lutibacter sp. Hel_I_33_5]TVZ55954.1 hypothetical protein OD91_1228 [Lutibacter sp. Hel_I_33_5]